MKPNKHEVVITGASGFVGRRVINQIGKYYDKSKVLCLECDKANILESSGRKVLKNSGIATIKVDLVTGKGLGELTKNPKVVIHLAAQTDTSRTDHRVNDVGVENLYKAFGELDKQTHFVHVSTMIIAGGRIDCSKPINEKSADCPTNEYTRTKMKGEQFLIKKCKEDGFKLTVLRPNTIYGSGPRPGSLFDMLKKMISENSIVTKLNWPGRSALIHVDDFAKAVLKFSKKGPKPAIAEKYLVYAENLSISDISRIMHKAMSKKYSPIVVPCYFWGVLAWGRRITPHMEKYLSPAVYNWMWRSTVIVDHAVECKSSKAAKVLRGMKFAKLKEKIEDMT